MTWANLDDATAQLQDHGLLLDSVTKTQGGRAAGLLYIDSIKPVKCKASTGGTQGGWYWLMEKELRGERYITGAFGVYEGADIGKHAIKINFDGKAIRLTPDERAAIKARHDARMKHATAMRRAEAERASQRAGRVWRAYVAAGESEYLKRKSVAAHGLRFSPSGNGTLAVPMLRGGIVMGLQIIRGKNRAERTLEKEYFPAGMDKTGAYHQLGRIVGGGICIIAEGYATGASLFEALGQTVPVAVAFDAGSLMPVARSIAANYRNIRILIAADDDRVQKCRECGKKTAIDLIDTAPAPDAAPAATLITAPTNALQASPTNTTAAAIARCIHCNQAHGQKNPGIEAAQNAAHAVAGSFIVPQFAVERKNDAKGPNDFNDLQALEGQHAVRLQVEAHLAGLGWFGAVSRAANRTTEGAGQATKAANANTKGGGESAEGDAARPAMPSQIESDEAVKRFSLVYGGKGTLFDHVEHMLVPKSDVMDILPKGAWSYLKMQGGIPVVRLGEVGFDPAETDPNIRCNLWSGWPTVPREGKCDIVLSVLEHLCAEEQNSRDIYHWVLKWLAYPIQHPGAKMRTALVFHGPQGVGKNLFFESIMRIYGRYGGIIDQAAVEDKFNDWASAKLYMIADEVVARNELFHLKNKLKGIVTNPSIRINPKNVAAHDEKNHVNVVFLSNERQPLVLEKDDRRYTVVWTPAKMDTEFYDEVKQEIDRGAIAALHHHLLNLDLGDFSEFSAAPSTQAKRDLIDISLDSIERFVRDWTGGDIILGDGVLPFCPCSSAEAYSAYKRWCGQEGVARPREQSAFKGHLVKLKGWAIGHKDRYSSLHYTGSTIRSRMIVPSAEALGDVAKRLGGDDYRKPDDKLTAEWLTECFFAFQLALGNEK